MYTYLLNGDVSLSITMTLISTFASLGKFATQEERCNYTTNPTEHCPAYWLSKFCQAVVECPLIYVCRASTGQIIQAQWALSLADIVWWMIDQ